MLNKMKNLNNIIQEEINRYLKRNIFEKQSGNYYTPDDDKHEGTDQFAKELRARMDNGTLNLRRVVSQITGIDTDTSNEENVSDLNAATSLYRKKIKGEEGANGGQFSLTDDEASKIETAMNKNI